MIFNDCYQICSCAHLKQRAREEALALNILLFSTDSKFMLLICLLSLSVTQSTSFTMTKPLGSLQPLSHTPTQWTITAVSTWNLCVCKFAFICMCFDYRASVPLVCRPVHPCSARYVTSCPPLCTKSNLWTEEGKRKERKGNGILLFDMGLA